MSSTFKPSVGDTLVTGALTIVGTSTLNGVNVATESYVTTAIGDYVNGLDWKNSVRVATTANLVATRASNVLTADANGSINSPGIDGITDLAVADRILVKDQSTGADNGIYVVTTVGTGGAPFVLTRAADANASSEITAALVVVASEGTTNGNYAFKLTTDDPITLNTTSLTFEAFVPASAGVTAVGAVGSSPNANAASISGVTLTLQPADGSNPGVLTAGAQTIGGAKTFSSTVAASNLSGTNSGDVTLAAIGSSPNANAASLSGQALTLQPASASFGGVVTTGTQSFAGAKTFTGAISASNLSGTNSGDVTAAAIGSTPNANGFTLTSQALNLEPASASFGGVVTSGTQTFAGAKTMAANFTVSSGTPVFEVAVATGEIKFSGSAGSSGQVLTSGGSGAAPTWTTVSSGVTTMTAFGSSPNANGATISGANLTLQPANGSNPGGVSTTTQTFAGAKTMTSKLTVADTDTTALTSSFDVTFSRGDGSRSMQVKNTNASGNVAGILVWNQRTDTAIGENACIEFKGRGTSALPGYDAGSGWYTVPTTSNGSKILIYGHDTASGYNQAMQITDTQQTIIGSGSTITSGFQARVQGKFETTDNMTVAGTIVATSTITGSNLSGTNTGDVTLAAIGSSPNANGASLSSQALTLQPASASFGGVVTTAAQSFAGIKNFGDGLKIIGQQHTTGSAAPGSGTYAVGDVVWNNAPVAGGSMGFVCVTAGTPGTWREWGLISLT